MTTHPARQNLSTEQRCAASSSAPACRTRGQWRRHAGVTLVELIVVITISGIIAAVLGKIIIRPIQGYESQVRRTAMVDAAEMTVRRLGRDIRQALPNSVRVRDNGVGVDTVSCVTAGQVCTIEMLNTVDGARYRDGPGQLPGGHNHADPKFRLQINSTDSDGFNIAGFFQNIPSLNVSPFNFTSTTERLAIYNQTTTGTTGNAYYDGDELQPVPSTYVITRPGLTTFRIDPDNDGNPNSGDEHWIRPVTGNFRFGFASLNQRVYIVDTPISYVCTAGPTGTIKRYSGYSITKAQAVTPGGATNISLLSTPVSACSITYSTGSPQRAGLVTIDITVTDATSGEQVRLLRQVHVDNSP